MDALFPSFDLVDSFNNPDGFIPQTSPLNLHDYGNAIATIPAPQQPPATPETPKKRPRNPKADRDSKIKRKFRKALCKAEAEAYLRAISPSGSFKSQQAASLAEKIFDEHLHGLSYLDDGERARIREIIFSKIGKGKYGEAPKVREKDPTVSSLTDAGTLSFDDPLVPQFDNIAAASEGESKAPKAKKNKKNKKSKKVSEDKKPDSSSSDSEAEPRKKKKKKKEKAAATGEGEGTPLVVNKAPQAVKVVIKKPSPPPPPPTLEESIRAIVENPDYTADERDFLVLELQSQAQKAASDKTRAEAEANSAVIQAEIEAIAKRLEAEKARIEAARAEQAEIDRRLQASRAMLRTCPNCNRDFRNLFRVCYSCTHEVCAGCFVGSVRTLLTGAKKGVLIECPWCLVEEKQPEIAPNSIAATMTVSSRRMMDPRLFIESIESLSEDKKEERTTHRLGKEVLQHFFNHQMTSEVLFDPECRMVARSRMATCPRCACISPMPTNNALNAHRCINPMCAIVYCGECSVPYHVGITCEDHQAKADSGMDEGTAVLISSTSRRCPGCGTAITKHANHGCIIVSCTTCTTKFCYHCMAHGGKPHSDKCLQSLGCLQDGSCGCTPCPVCAADPSKPCKDSNMAK